MDTYHVVLYIHLMALFVGIGAGAVLLVCLFQLRNAQMLEAAAPWGRVAGKTGLAFPVAILGLFGTGAYMTADVWTWSTGWIAVSIAGLVLLALQVRSSPNARRRSSSGHGTRTARVRSGRKRDG